MRQNVDMMDFIRAHESSENSAEVSKKTGLAIASVEARASKYRTTEYIKIPKKNSKGEILYRTPDGTGETADKGSAKLSSQGKPITIMVRKLENGKPIVKREALDLKKFNGGGGSRLDIEAAKTLLAELRGKTKETKVGVETVS